MFIVIVLISFIQLTKTICNQSFSSTLYLIKGISKIKVTLAKILKFFKMLRTPGQLINCVL